MTERADVAGASPLSAVPQVAPERNELAPDAPPAGHRLGLALSGGGLRAASFHRGTVRALARLGLLPAVDVISTVSGGSLFGGSWMAARARGEGDDAFLSRMAAELQRGFLDRALRLPALKMLLPGYTRTNVIADTFDRVLFRGVTLADLPASPRLCINATVLNHGQVAKFSRDGFWTQDVMPQGQSRADYIPLPKFRTALAVAASAAFPVGLPPLLLSRKRDLGGATFENALTGHETLALSDGGVLENLGVQTLLNGRFRTWDLVVSDAGLREGGWKPGGALGPLRSALIAAATGGALEQLMQVMNNKQNRWTRYATVDALEDSWAAEVLRHLSAPAPHRTLPTGMEEWLAARPRFQRRRLLFVRVNQTWEHMLQALASRDGCWRLAELRGRSGNSGPLPPQGDIPAIEAFLAKCGVDLTAAKAAYDAMGGKQRAEALNRVATGITGLPAKDVADLATHAEWQILAEHALYW